MQSVGEELGGDRAATPVALVWTDGWQLAFVVLRQKDAYATVVVPDAPAVTSGTVLYLQERVHEIDLGVADVLKIQRRMGLGAAQLLSGKVPQPPPDA